MEQSIFITARDANGCVLPDHSVQFEVDFVGPSTPVAAVTAAPDLGPGVYRATYVPVARGSSGDFGWEAWDRFSARRTAKGTASGSTATARPGDGGPPTRPLTRGAAFTAAAWVRGDRLAMPPPLRPRRALRGRRGGEEAPAADLRDRNPPPPRTTTFSSRVRLGRQAGRQGLLFGLLRGLTELKAGVYVENEVSLTQRASVGWLPRQTGSPPLQWSRTSGL